MTAVFIITAFIFLFSTPSSLAAKPGDACTDDASCDSANTFLECPADKKCVCQESPDSYFDTYDNKCHKKAKVPCVTPGMPCCFNSVCYPSNKLCECNSGFPITDTKKCARAYGTTCTQPYNCDRDKYMVCGTTDKRCGCDEATSVYEQASGSCVLTLNQPCSTDEGSQTCVDGSECKTDGDVDLKCRCSEGTSENEGQCQLDFGGTCDFDHVCNGAKYLKCLEGTCVCDDGFDDVGSGVCQANYDHSCAAEEPCNEKIFLACKDGKCKCRDDLTDLGGTGDCRARFDGTCSADGTNNPKCDDTQFLECVDSRCKCNGDLIANDNGECRAPLGASCEQGEICDEVANLVCDNGESGTNKCKCSGTLQPVGGVCVAAFNEHCENGKVPCNGELFLECHSDNVCKCSIGLIDIGQGNCRSMFDAYCDSGLAPCDENSFHKCQDSKCACLPGLQHIGEGECRTKLGMGPCDGEGQPKCDENNFLFCNHADQDNPVCTCQDNWSATDGTCLAGAGVSCANGEPCDTTKYLECGPQGGAGKVCQCRSDLVGTENGDCRLTVGDPCNSADELKCDETAFLACVDGSCSCGVNSM